MARPALALALLGGVDVRAETVAYVEQHTAAIEAAPWHAAQVVAALGKDAPLTLWSACTRDLARQAWAPWTILGAHARRDKQAMARMLPALIASIRGASPHRGAVAATGVAEVAITALTLEALRVFKPTRATRSAIAAAEAFLLRCQLRSSTLPGLFTTLGTEGAFTASPTSSLLRCDVTAHALLALCDGAQIDSCGTDR